MASTEIRQLLQPPSQSTSQEQALEFINARFKSLSQPEFEDNLRRVVDEARQRTDDLYLQARPTAALQQYQVATDEHTSQALAQTRKHLASAQDLALTRHALSDELSSLSAELVSSLNREEQPQLSLLEELELLHRNLKELESVRNYISIVEHALRLSEVAIAQTRQTLSSSQSTPFSSKCLSQYRQLQTFVSTVFSTCSSVENPSLNMPYSPSPREMQPLKIVAFLLKLRDRTWRDINNILSSKFLEIIEKLGWPQAIEYTSVLAQDRLLFESAFSDLIRLQDAGDEVHASDPNWKCKDVYPIQALTIPIALRFKFHFESKRETNRLDKPEWYFTHILNVTHIHRPFLETHVQSLLSSTEHKHINAFREFTLHLLPLLTRKLIHAIPRLLHHPSLLAHTIYQALAFDASLREQGFALEGTSATMLTNSKNVGAHYEGWEGVSNDILSNKEWFEAWLEGERKFADDQYNEIISSPDSWQISDEDDNQDSSIDLELRPTNSARRVKALVEQITDRYQPLPRFTARTRFLIAIQIPILESYHSRISSSLDAFETLSSSFVRAVPGALAGQVGHGHDTRRLTSGVEGVGRLVKACVSAHFVATEMERWGEDIFFLELWSEINARAALRARAEAHPLLPDPWREIQPKNTVDTEAVANGTIFQELVTQYRLLGGRAEDMIVRHVSSEVESESKSYFSRQWGDNSAADEGMSGPTALVVPISLLSSHLTYLSRSLPTSLITNLYRRVTSTLAAILLQRRVLQRGAGRLSLIEAKQVAGECLLWVQTCRVAVGPVVRRVEGPWARLLGAMKLLTLDAKQFGEVVTRIFNTRAEELEELQNDLGVEDLDLGDLIDIEIVILLACGVDVLCEMIAEILLILAGHDSSLFQGPSIHPSFTPLLHPGEQQALESLAQIATRYRRVRSFCNSSLLSKNRYICALCSTLNAILRDEYESLVVNTESRILQCDSAFVGNGSFVPVSSIRATFSPWDAPLKSLELLLDQLEEKAEWPPGPLIDLLERANTGVRAVSSLISRISIAVQKLWVADISAFMIHGTVSSVLPLAVEPNLSSSKSPTSTYVLKDGAMPSCVSTQTRESILYVGRAIATVKRARKWTKQFPRSMAIHHANLLEGTYPQDMHNFDCVISEVRHNVSQWLWLNVLTQEDVEDAVESLGNYFLLRNGEFGLTLIREFERLKLSRMTLNPSSRQIHMIREQDLHLAMLRASLGTSAQYDPTLTRLRFVLPAGPLRPLLPSLQSTSAMQSPQHASFDDLILGTPLKLTYTLPWPLDLFLTPTALASYDSLFSFLLTIRKTHVRVQESWVSLSNAQRARRRWTGTGEGGTEEDREARERLLRCGWGCARTMNWFLEAVMEYVWCDVVEEEYTKLKAQLKTTERKGGRQPATPISEPPDLISARDVSTSAEPKHLDFNTLRVLHNIYLHHLLDNTLVSQPLLSATLRSIFETCEQFVAQIERWGGDVLPALLFEGSLADGGGTKVGEMVLQRWEVVKQINERLTSLLNTFYEQLSLMISQPFTSSGDASARSFIMNTTSATFHSFARPREARGGDSFGETRRHVERLLLRLDFSGGFSKPQAAFSGSAASTGEILRQGGLA